MLLHFGGVQLELRQHPGSVKLEAEIDEMVIESSLVVSSDDSSKIAIVYYLKLQFQEVHGNLGIPS